jgi:hypothetical protein
MKRWQDRGEVQDSDDEDLSLDAESQSPARKKPRLAEHSSASAAGPDLETRQVSVQDCTEDGDGEEAEWLLPGVAVTYGKNGSSKKPSTAQRAPLNSSRSTQDVPESPVDISDDPDVAPELVEADEQDIPPSSSSDGLLDLDQLLKHSRASHSPAMDEESPLSSVPSSPLSEREVSPPAGFQITADADEQLLLPAEPSPIDQVAGEDTTPVPKQSVPHQIPRPAQRSFRARKEKQLHPYLFELAQYQKQCRDRGLRPIRVAETQAVNNDTQDGSVSENDGAPSPAQPDSADEVTNRRGETRHRSQTTDVHDISSPEDDDDLPNMDRLLAKGGPEAYSGQKRRKLFHHRKDAPEFTQSEESQDVFSMPLSPPSTSSSSQHGPSRMPLKSGFRMPPGLSPAPLPTPQVSSEVRRNAKDSLTHSLPASRRQPVLIESSSESSEEELEEEVDERRLMRERKRIRGVLPASWLKIDFHAQQKRTEPLPHETRREISTSPLKTSHQKGVAQRVNRSSIQSRHDVISISDDDEEARDGETIPPSPREFNKTREFSSPHKPIFAATDFGDDERMENDWVDPMFGASSARNTNHRRRKRQPKIIEAFHRSEQNGDVFSEERRSIRTARGGAKHTKRRNRPSGERSRQTPVHHRLSILDAPTVRRASEEPIPSFVRVAMRTARQRHDLGRQSPTGKHVRLTTMEDTDDAAAVLHAWREGTITPGVHVSGPSELLDRFGIQPPSRQSRSPSPSRIPLSETSSNRQMRLPDASRKETKPRNPKSTSVRTLNGPRIRQTTLRPEVTILHNTVPTTPGPLADPNHSPKHVEQHRRVLRPESHRPVLRTAQLESLETAFNQEHRSAAFERRIQLLTENVRRHARSPHVNVERFIEDAHTVQIMSNGEVQHGDPREMRIANPSRKLVHRTRKHQARHLDADAREYRQPSEPLPTSVDVVVAPHASLPASGASETLEGLGPYGTKYATDFDIQPLAIGMYFHESSFIGSGDFAASLDFAKRNLDSSTGRIRIHADGKVLEWGPWTEDVSSGLNHISDAIAKAFQSLDCTTDGGSQVDASVVLLNVDYLLRSTIRYFARCVAFLDPVDRQSCAQRLIHFAQDLLELTTDDICKSRTADVGIRCLQYAFVLSNQAATLCEHPPIMNRVKEQALDILGQASTRFASALCPGRFGELRSFLEDNKRATSREAGIRDSAQMVSGLVILRHVLDRNATEKPCFWSTISQACGFNVEKLRNVSQFDSAWCNLYSILPLLNIDQRGIASSHIRTNEIVENWSLPRNLITRLLNLYAATSVTHGTTVNDYVRANLIRCFKLQSKWGWWKCEPILGTIFDFFARRNLALLHKEESRGSPRFLEELEREITLDVSPEDRSFSIFLKLLASGLQNMHRHGNYNEKKIGSVAWRFIPNHGRTYRKDTEVRQDDLDALRNHHDLLCVLYYATPASYRLRPTLIHALVDHSASHREACRINIRAWSNLAAFQASRPEPPERVDAFTMWLRDVINTTITQFRLARIEVERDAAVANAQGQLHVPQYLIEDTIIKNQRQIVATVVDALAALKRSLLAASSIEVAARLVQSSEFWQALDIFEPSSRRLNGMVDEVLSIAQTALEVQARFTVGVESQSGSDESQDYGDSSALQELASTQLNLQPCDQMIADILHPHLLQLVSNIFGADSSADDAMLTKVVDTWINTAATMIQSGKRSWSDYTGNYASESWTQLRDTDQRRKLTPYFLARTAERAVVDLEENGILSSWLISLVEREAMLKYQHVLTTALLNRHAHEPLVRNLPFSMARAGRYEVSMTEFRQRRLSLMDCVLSNMRHSFDKAMYDQPHLIQALRRQYMSLLKQIMQAMKNNYLDLQAAGQNEVADGHVQGAYVEFVQHVVSSMQQYTAEICPVDRFFTDSTAFPLPSTDPSYVIGRLRAYVPKLSESRKRKELAMFILTTSERAAVDNQQPYFVDQLTAAMTGVLERGNHRTPNLRHVLFTAVLPAFIESALSTACSWILVKPILQACGHIASDLLYNVILEDAGSVDVAMETLLALLHSLGHPLELVVMHPGQTRLPHAQTILAEIFAVARQCLVVVQHLQRISSRSVALQAATHRLMSFASLIESDLSDEEDADLIDVPEAGQPISPPWPDTLEFSRKQLRDRLSNEWHANEGQYFVKRGTSSVEVTAGLQDEPECRLKLLEQIRAFQGSFDAVMGGSVVQHYHEVNVSDEELIV